MRFPRPLFSSSFALLRCRLSSRVSILVPPSPFPLSFSQTPKNRQQGKDTFTLLYIKNDLCLYVLISLPCSPLFTKQMAIHPARLRSLLRASAQPTLDPNQLTNLMGVYRKPGIARNTRQPTAIVARQYRIRNAVPVRGHSRRRTVLARASGHRMAENRLRWRRVHLRVSRGPGPKGRRRDSEDPGHGGHAGAKPGGRRSEPAAEMRDDDGAVTADVYNINVDGRRERVREQES